MKFREFIRENKEVHHVFAFGRMSPPTTGHEVLVNKVKEVADKVGGSHSVILSHTQDKVKNPLSSADKLKHAKRFFPKTNLSVSDKESPNFLTQAAKLHKQGVTHLHMVAGSDRVPEYKKLLKKYNGTHPDALFNFKKVTVHNAGERDPDAEGAAGMSASKMREHAQNNRFDDYIDKDGKKKQGFKGGIPSHVPEHHAREMFRDVRKGMQIKEDVDVEFQSLLVEGVHDKAIFKAVFLAGGPGSGKDYVLDNTLAGHGLTEINSDKALEFLMDKEGLDKTMPASEQEKRDFVRGRAKNMTELRQKLALLGRNGLIINGTGDDVEKIKKIKERLETVGYDTSMLLVQTDDEVSKLRNIERGSRGGRTVPEEIRKQKWDGVQAGRVEFAKMFGQNYMEFDNSEDLRQAPPELVKQKKDEMLDLFTRIKEFVSTPPANETAEAWVAMELHKKDTLEIPKDGAEQTPHPDSGAADEARKLGLQYYGFGRYGRDGKVTHRSVHDKLIEVDQDQPKEPNIPVPGTSMKKRVNEDFDQEFGGLLSEAVTLSITGDTVDEVQSMISSIQGYGLNTDDSEYQIDLSDTNESLTLGKHVATIGDKQDDLVITNDDVKNILEEKKVKLLRDISGKPRIFMLRRSAAKEAHINGGEVMKHPKGYAIKIKEDNQNDSIFQEPIQEGTTSRTRAKSGSGRTILTESGDYTTSTGLESGNYNTTPAAESIGTKSSEQGNTAGKTKITLAQIRYKQKTTTKESIDKGIEPGLSMASAGENMSRGLTKTKLIKKPLEEMQGDETGASIGDQKEDELKKKGINLSSFKSKRVI